MKIKKILYKYRIPIILLFIPVYWIWFCWLEKNIDVDYFIVHCKLDDFIPFCEYFIVPYLVWFGYVIISLAIMFFDFEHQNDFYRTSALLISGMIGSLIIYTIFPNGQDLRPEILPRDNIFAKLVGSLYRGDTPTNVLPSLHVYNSIVVHDGLSKSHILKDKTIIKYISLILCIMICLSTVFLKQHSVVDVFAACIMFIILKMISKYIL